MSTDCGEFRSILTNARGPIVRSRAINPVLSDQLLRLGRDDIVVRPTVRGSTVWGDVADATLMIEHPNWFGRPETVPPARVVVLVHDVDWAFPRTPCHHRFFMAESRLESVRSDPRRPDRLPDGPSGYIVATRQARRLALLGGQVPGFRLAHGKPRSPLFVAMLPFDPHQVTSALAGTGDISAEPVGPQFPDLPGGVRVRVDASASERSLREWVGALDEVVRSGKRVDS